MSADDEASSLSWEAWLEILPQTLAAIANENRNFPGETVEAEPELAVYGLRQGACLILVRDRDHAQRLYQGLVELLADEQIELLAEGWSDGKDTFALAVAADAGVLESSLAGGS